MPLFTQTDMVVCDAEKLKSPRPKWPEDYQDLSFTMLRGDGIAGYKFDKMAENKKIRVTFLNSNFTAIKHVLIGNSDCTVISKTPSWGLL